MTGREIIAKAIHDEPLKVGDVLETVEDLERLPVGAILTDKDGDAWQQPAYLVFKCTYPVESARAKDVIKHAPFTIRYIPGVGE